MVEELGISLSLGLFELWYLALQRDSGRILLTPDITGCVGGGMGGTKSLAHHQDMRFSVSFVPLS